jgi:hypothetical protein
MAQKITATLEDDLDGGPAVPQQAGSAAGISRAWGDHGITVSGRGRIPAHVAGQYEAAITGR